MHHSETPIPGTFAAVSILVVAGGIIATLVISALYGLYVLTGWGVHHL